MIYHLNHKISLSTFLNNTVAIVKTINFVNNRPTLTGSFKTITIDMID